MKIVDKLKQYVESKKFENHDIARWLLNCHIHSHTPLSLSDLSDNSVVASEMEAVVECIGLGDYTDAVTVAEEGAVNILHEEGFELNIDSEESY